MGLGEIIANHTLSVQGKGLQVQYNENYFDSGILMCYDFSWEKVS